VPQDLIPNEMPPIELAPQRERPAFPLVTGRVVGLAGLEPAASSLSAIEGSPLCGPAFSQVAADRRGRSNAVLATSFQAVQARGL
jgi:hypothetical protein